MLRTDDIMDTLRMFRQENLDVRSVTLGLNLLDCADPSVESLCKKIRLKINRMAGEKAVFGGLFGESVVLPVIAPDSASAFINHGGRIPAPLQALNN